MSVHRLDTRPTLAEIAAKIAAGTPYMRFVSDEALDTAIAAFFEAVDLRGQRVVEVLRPDFKPIADRMNERGASVTLVRSIADVRAETYDYAVLLGLYGGMGEAAAVAHNVIIMEKLVRNPVYIQEALISAGLPKEGITMKLCGNWPSDYCHLIVARRSR